MKLIISTPFHTCVQCDFFIHTQCTKLPTRIMQHPLSDFYTLKLLPWAPTKSVFFCDICSRHHCGFTYNCPEFSLLWAFFDIQCGSILKMLKYEGHLFYLSLYSKMRKCKAYPKDNKKYVLIPMHQL